MAIYNGVYKCEVCGNIVQVNHEGPGALSCCNQEMKLLNELTADSSTEKHVPVIEKIDGGYKVYVGSTLHPMTEEPLIHFQGLEYCKRLLQLSKGLRQLQDF